MTEQGRRPGLVLPAVLLALALLVGLTAIGRGLRQLRTDDRYVTVKGIAEREVQADLALWPLRFTAAADELAAAQGQIEASRRTAIEFLGRHGIDTAAVALQGMEVTDVHANPWHSGPVTNRYIIQQSLMVRSQQVATVERASQRVGELVEAGVVLGGQRGPASGPTYLFTGLTAKKPEMLAEATANARRAAEQFAADSGSKVGGIRHANQGVFQILARDRAPGVAEAGQRHKMLRVVSTVQYYLED